MAKKDYKVWLSDEDYQKAVGQARLQFNGIFAPFNKYGLDIFIPRAIDECVTLLAQFGKLVRGRDIPITVIKKKVKNVNR